jgi:hypothetical protein
VTRREELRRVLVNTFRIIFAVLFCGATQCAHESNSGERRRVRLLRPHLLFRNEPLHELGALFLVGVDSFVEQHLADLRNISLLIISNPLNFALKFRVNA